MFPAHGVARMSAIEGMAACKGVWLYSIPCRLRSYTRSHLAFSLATQGIFWKYYNFTHTGVCYHVWWMESTSKNSKSKLGYILIVQHSKPLQSLTRIHLPPGGRRMPSFHELNYFPKLILLIILCGFYWNLDSVETNIVHVVLINSSYQ